MSIGDSFLPPLGQPSLTRDEIISLYVKYGINDYTEGDISSDLENANKYSAVGIEGQIAKRASNVPGSGYAPVPTIAVVRSVAPALPPPVDASVAGNVVASGTAAGGTTTAVGPTGLLVTTQGPNTLAGPVYTAAAVPSVVPSSTFLGFDTTTLIIIAGVGVAAWFLLRK